MSLATLLSWAPPIAKAARGVWDAITGPRIPADPEYPGDATAQRQGVAAGEAARREGKRAGPLKANAPKL